MALKYKRILLKISGEALGGEKGMGFDEPTMDAICGGVKKAHELGVQIGIVVGGGNFWRGRSSGKMERTLADKIGMLATVMNALAVSDKLEQLGVPTEVFTSITMPQVAQPFTRKDALRAMDERLVGSEMCIRDSGYRAARRGGERRRDVQGNHGGRRLR